MVVGVGKLYYENLFGGINVSIMVNNVGFVLVELVVICVDVFVIMYMIFVGNSFMLLVYLLFVVVLLIMVVGVLIGMI